MYNDDDRHSNNNDYYDPDNLSSYNDSSNREYWQQPYYTEKKSRSTAKTIFFLFLIILLTAGIIKGYESVKNGNLFNDKGNKSRTSESTKGGFNLEKATGSAMTVKEIAKKVSDSVVEIRTESVVRNSWIQEYVTEGAGSGVIIKTDGSIITNYHVIQNARRIYVKIDPNSNKEYEARVVKANRQNDVALLKINAKDLSAATFGNSDDIEAGDMAVVVGNPLGTLGDTVSAGIISSKERTITMDNRQMRLIQTDASINPGNSGGGLFNDHAQLVGLVVAKSAGENIEGLGFAIPIKTALKAIEK